MTLEELNLEWDHIYQTRVAILCGTDYPTPGQKQIAADEADEHIRRLTM